MHNSVSRGDSGEINRNVVMHAPPSKLKTYGFVIAIIVGIGGLALGGAGVAGYFQVGTLSHMAQIDAIILMAEFGGIGAILFIIGVVGTVKNRQGESAQQPRGMPIDNVNINLADLDTQGGRVYGPRIWQALGQKWGCTLEVLDEGVGEASEIDPTKKGKIYIYIPQKIKLNGLERHFTLSLLIEISKIPISFICPKIQGRNEKNAASGWIEMDIVPIPETLNKNYETQKKIVEAKGCRIPSVVEAVVRNLMLYTFFDELREKKSSWGYTRCSDKGRDKTVIVGLLGREGLHVNYGIGLKTGVAAVRKL